MRIHFHTGIFSLKLAFKGVLLDSLTSATASKSPDSLSDDFSILEFEERFGEKRMGEKVILYIQV